MTRARPGLVLAWLLAQLVAVFFLSSPIALLAVTAGLGAMAVTLGAKAQLRRALRLTIPLAVVLIVLLALVDRNGLTVAWRFGSLGPLGEVDVTVEALVGGFVQALRLVASVEIGVLMVAVLDSDRLLAGLRRIAPRGSVTATLALRLAPVLVDDAQRYADGLRCRADGGALGGRERVMVMRAILARTLDRAGDAAATLELRGLASPQIARSRAPRRPLDRLERWLVASVTLLVVDVIALAATGAGAFTIYPELGPLEPLRALLVAAAILGAAALPVRAARRLDREGRR